MASLPKRDYREILHDLEELEAYLTSLGFRRAPGRLRGIIANLREIEKARAENRLLSLNTHPRVSELVWSVVEGQEFAEIFRGIRGYDPQIVKALMRRALKGPLHPNNETTRSNFARNTIFELLLGARLRRAGASVTLGQEADLLIDCAGGRLYIECKRPLYERTIEENVAEARSQLRRRFDADPHPNSLGGLVAISISKAINPGLNWFMVDEEKDVEQLTRDVNRIHEQYCRDYDRQIDPRLLGMLYHIFTPVMVRKAGLFCAFHFEIFLVTSGWQTVFPLSGDALKQFLSRL